MHECSQCGAYLTVFHSYICSGALYEECYCKYCGHEEDFVKEIYDDDSDY